MVAQLPLALQLREGNDLSNFVAGQNGALFQGIRETVVGTDRQACIWGPEGQGKSHLLEGAVRLAQQHGMNACLLPAEELLHPLRLPVGCVSLGRTMDMSMS